MIRHDSETSSLIVYVTISSNLEFLFCLLPLSYFTPPSPPPSLSLSLSLSSSLFPSIPPNFASGEILNNQKAMEYNTQTGNLACAFNFMQLRRIKRNSDKKASEVSPTLELIFRRRLVWYCIYINLFIMLQHCVQNTSTFYYNAFFVKKSGTFM